MGVGVEGGRLGLREEGGSVKRKEERVEDGVERLEKEEREGGRERAGRGEQEEFQSFC